MELFRVDPVLDRALEPVFRDLAGSGVTFVAEDKEDWTGDESYR